MILGTILGNLHAGYYGSRPMCPAVQLPLRHPNPTELVGHKEAKGHQHKWHPDAWIGPGSPLLPSTRPTSNDVDGLTCNGWIPWHLGNVLRLQNLAHGQCLLMCGVSCYFPDIPIWIAWTNCSILQILHPHLLFSLVHGFGSINLLLTCLNIQG